MAKRRPNGDGSVRKRADGRWEGSIVVGHKEDGSPIFKSVFARTQKELMPKLHALIDGYRGVELTEDSGITLNEWLDRWLEEYVKPTVKPNTYRGYTRYEKGFPKTKSVLARSKTECLEKLDKLKEQCGSINGNAKSDMPFGDWLKLWYETFSKPALRLTTQAGYENRIYKHIIPGVGGIPLRELTQSDLQQFYAGLKTTGRITNTELYGNGLSDRMVRGCHATCRAALEKAKQEGQIYINPAIGCKLPPKRAKEMQVLTQEEMRRFLLQAKEEGCYEMAVLELATGLRRGEFCALQWDDLNLQTGELRIQRQAYRVGKEVVISPPKTKASVRTVILPPAVLEILAAYRETVYSRWMFPSPVKEDSPWDPGAIRKKLQRVMAHAGCKVVRFHDLRHTFATTALENGMDVKTLSACIGHISASTTLDIYSHVTDSMQAQAAGRIEAEIGTGEAYTPRETPFTAAEEITPAPLENAKFEPYRGKIRRSGTGGIYELNDHLFEGRYTPTNAQGKREVHTVYAKTREECEAQLAEMIERVRADIKAEKEMATHPHMAQS